MNNNVFKPKTNSRFDSLKDDITPANAGRLNKPEPRARQTFFEEPKNNSFQRPTSFRDRITNEKEKFERDKKKKQADLEKSLMDVNAFPELNSSRVVKTEPIKEMNYIDKLKTECKEVVEEWIPQEIKKTVVKEQKVIPYALVEAYDKWKKQYIEDFGYDDYEHNYLFPNYDYEYFDKLDAIHELRMLEEDEKERENDRIDNECSNEYDDE